LERSVFLALAVWFFLLSISHDIMPVMLSEEGFSIGHRHLPVLVDDAGTLISHCGGNGVLEFILIAQTQTDVAIIRKELDAIKFFSYDSDICLSMSNENKLKDSITIAMRDQCPGT
jgi:hypothetical protein